MTKKKQAAAEPKAPEPMDPGVREEANPVLTPPNSRVCWAIKTLVSEVNDLFPETPVEYSGYNGRNTALAVTFDLTALDEPDRSDFKTLLLALPVEEHRRVEGVEVDDALVLVMMKPNARTQDIREPFGLPNAWLVLTETGVTPFESDPADVPGWVHPSTEIHPTEGGSL